MILLYVVVGLIAWWFNAGMMFAQFQGVAPTLAKEDRRENLGVAILLGGLFAFIWPIGVPITWLVTGFAEHGIWRVKPDARPRA
jgi:hypothetical protein